MARPTNKESSMKRFIIIALVLVVAIGTVSAQSEVGDDNPAMMGIESA